MPHCVAMCPSSTWCILPHWCVLILLVSVHVSLSYRCSGWTGQWARLEESGADTFCRLFHRDPIIITRLPLYGPIIVHTFYIFQTFTLKPGFVRPLSWATSVMGDHSSWTTICFWLRCTCIDKCDMWPVTTQIVFTCELQPEMMLNVTCHHSSRSYLIHSALNNMYLISLKWQNSFLL